MSATTEIASTYRDRAGRLVTLLEDVPAGAWDAPSPCEDWSVRDVVGHLVDSQRAIVTQVDLALPPGRAVADDPRGAFADVAAAMQEILDDPERAEREYDGAFGRTSLATTIETFYVFDLSVHRWDIARGAGLDTTFDQAELDSIERTLDVVGENLYEFGACRRIDVPEGADRVTTVLARLGRRP